MNDNASQVGLSDSADLMEYLREQVRYLREELTHCRAEIAAERQRCQEQLAQKDQQIIHLLHLVESTPHRDRGPVSEPLSQTVHGVNKEPAAVEAAPANDASGPEPRHQHVAARQYKRRSEVCPFLGANYDQAVTFTYVTKRNACWSPAYPKKRRQRCGSIPENHQAEYCLVERCTECPHFEVLQDGDRAN